MKTNLYVLIWRHRFTSKVHIITLYIMKSQIVVKTSLHHQYRGKYELFDTHPLIFSSTCRLFYHGDCLYTFFFNFKYEMPRYFIFFYFPAQYFRLIGFHCILYARAMYLFHENSLSILDVKALCTRRDFCWPSWFKHHCLIFMNVGCDETHSTSSNICQHYTIIHIRIFNRCSRTVSDGLGTLTWFTSLWIVVAVQYCWNTAAWLNILQHSTTLSNNPERPFTRYDFCRPTSSDKS